MPTSPLTALLRVLRPVLPARWRLPVAFDSKAYRALHADFAQGGGDPGLHFLRHGRREGRLPCALAAAQDERAVWTGDARAVMRLEQACNGPGSEAAWARLALARIAAYRGEWDKAAQHLGQPQDFAALIGLPDAMLLAIEMALRLGQLRQAETLCALTQEMFGAVAELTFLRAFLALCQGDREEWSRTIAEPYRSAQLSGPELGAAQGADAFDTLQATATKLTLGEDAPLVSVIMPARNAAATIETALTSLLAQTWHRIEVLVVVNGSNDNTEARVLHHAARDRRVRLFHSPAHLGTYGARNLGASLAQGAFLTVQDADDWSHPARLAQQLDHLRKAKRVTGVMTSWLRVTPDLCPVQARPDIRMVHPCVVSLLIPRGVLERLGPWDNIRAGADTEFVERLRHVFGSASIAQILPATPLVFGRSLPQSLSQTAQTGLLGEGAAARAAYLRAARAWHESAGTPKMPKGDHPDQVRPFAVPRALSLPTYPEDME